MNAGKLYRKNFKQPKLDLSEFMVLCREQGYFDINDIETAVFEHNGKLSILPVSLKRPATPEDLNLNPSSAHINIELIVDGRILEENLKRMGRDFRWLEKQLRNHDYKNPKQIFLCLCDSNGKLTLFKVD